MTNSTPCLAMTGKNVKTGPTRTSSKYIVVCVSAASMAVGCSALLRNAPTALDVKPVQTVKHSGEDGAAALYAIGRFYQGQLLYEDAIATYEQLLARDPNHAEARNALGVIYASQGKIDKAIEAIDNAIRMTPRASHLHNNLGYAYILQGRYAEAEVELVQATTLDPDNGRAAENLSLARARLTSFSDERTPTPMDRDMSADSPFPEIASENELRAQFIAAGPNVYELQFPPSGRTRRDEGPDGRRVGPMRGKGQRLALEVSNGNGITGFAKNTSRYLQKLGFPAARLTNQRPFHQERTEIQYRGGFQLQAQELKMALAGKPAVVESGQLRAGVEVRLVLGRDASPQTLLVQPNKIPVDSVSFEPHLLN